MFQDTAVKIQHYNIQVNNILPVSFLLFPGKNIGPKNIFHSFIKTKDLLVSKTL